MVNEIGCEVSLGTEEVAASLVHPVDKLGEVCRCNITIRQVRQLVCCWHSALQSDTL